MNPNPQQIAESLVNLAEEYSRLSDEDGLLEQGSIKYFVDNRDKYASDKACERAYLATEGGLRWVIVQKRLKVLNKQTSISKTILRHYENQARNLY